MQPDATIAAAPKRIVATTRAAPPPPSSISQRPPATSQHRGEGDHRFDPLWCHALQGQLESCGSKFKVSVSPDGPAATCFQNYPNKETGIGKYVTLVSDKTVLEAAVAALATAQADSPGPVVPKAGRFRIRIEHWDRDRSYVLFGIVPSSTVPPCPETCERGISGIGGCCVTIVSSESPDKDCHVNGPPGWKWVRPPWQQQWKMDALLVPVGGEVEMIFDFELHRATVKVVVPGGGAADARVDEFTLPEGWTDGRPAVSFHHRDSVRFVPLS
jgi:hypothetical protein